MHVDASPSAGRHSELRLPDNAGAPTAARTFVRDLLASWRCDDPGRVAELLTSELVSNVVLHARTSLRIDASLSGAVLRVAVSDRVAAFPDRSELPDRMPLPDAEGGRGLQLVDLLARTWGVEASDEGKSVWFESDVRCERSG
jgi:anti-sigma regulatory factor (Ser/Thr protein kinase)